MVEAACLAHMVKRRGYEASASDNEPAPVSLAASSNGAIHMRLHTTNGRVVEFAYRPSQTDQNVLVSSGKSAEQAAEDQYYTVTPEGAELPESVATYALGLYSTQMEAAGNEAREPAEVVVSSVWDGEPIDPEGSTTTSASVSAGVEVSGTLEPKATCVECSPYEVFTAKSLSGAKSRLRAHTSKVHA